MRGGLGRLPTVVAGTPTATTHPAVQRENTAVAINGFTPEHLHVGRRRRPRKRSKRLRKGRRNRPDNSSSPSFLHLFLRCCCRGCGRCWLLLLTSDTEERASCLASIGPGTKHADLRWRIIDGPSFDTLPLPRRLPLHVLDWSQVPATGVLLPRGNGRCPRLSPPSRSDDRFRACCMHGWSCGCWSFGWWSSYWRGEKRLLR